MAGASNGSGCSRLTRTWTQTVPDSPASRLPELEWRYGYMYAIGLMVASVAAPFVYFRRKGWLT